MNRTIKLWISFSIVLITAGLLIFVFAMTKGNWDFYIFDNNEYETNTYEIKEDFNDIVIETDTSDIEFVIATDGVCKVITKENQKAKHSVNVIDRKLNIIISDELKWYDNIGIVTENTKITVFLPDNIYSYIKIDASTSDVNLKNICVDKIDISLSTGDVELSNIVCNGDIKIDLSTGKVELENILCKNFTTEGSTGDLEMSNLVASEKIDIERDTGDVDFYKCDAAEIYIETDTGDVKGSLLSEKVFIIKTDTGKRDYPNTITGGRCEITTDTGNIKITINK